MSSWKWWLAGGVGVATLAWSMRGQLAAIKSDSAGVLELLDELKAGDDDEGAGDEAGEEEVKEDASIAAQAVMPWLPVLRSAVMERLDSGPVLRQLKEAKRGAKEAAKKAVAEGGDGKSAAAGGKELVLKLWARFQHLELARLLLPCYVVPLLQLVVRSTFAIIMRGRHTAALVSASGKDAPPIVDADLQPTVLRLAVTHVVSGAVHGLADMVEAAVQPVLGDLNPKQPLTMGELLSKISMARLRCEGGTPLPCSQIQQLALPEEEALEKAGGEHGSAVIGVLHMLYDVVESPHFGLALQDSVDSMFALQTKLLRQHLFPDADVEPAKALPAASFVPALRKVYTPLLKEGSVMQQQCCLPSGSALFSGVRHIEVEEVTPEDPLMSLTAMLDMLEAVDEEAGGAAAGGGGEQGGPAVISEIVRPALPSPAAGSP
eukprot:PLAT15552.3.p1 GENE.PLAT15552.3~~PLAT15552.3.p1  ORF type:complete len:433 (-),score=234.33 PLAT15552.3:95-1393(-)